MRIGRNLLFLALAAAVAGLFHATLQRGHVAVCYYLGSESDTNTGIYWDTGSGFSETRRMGRPVSGGDGMSEVCLSSRRMPARGLLRIDPVQYPGSFRLENVRILPLGAIWPGLFQVRISTDEALKLNEVVEKQNGYQALGGDPYLVWRYDAGISPAIVYLFNMGVLFFAVLLAGMVYHRLGRGARSRELPYSVLAVFGFYVCYVAAGWITLPLSDLLVYSHWALGWTMILMFIFLAGYATGKFTWQAAPCGAALSLIALVIGVDAAYRLGATDGQLFARVSHDSYQWRLFRSWDENLRHSSIKYHDEFNELRPLVQDGAYFIADKATSYYVAAALPLYPRITHPHHSHMSKKPDLRFLAALCEEGGSAKAVRILDSVRRDIGTPGSIYLILVKDPGNKNIRSQCTSANHDVVIANLAGLGEPLFSGRMVTVFRLPGETAADDTTAGGG